MLAMQKLDLDRPYLSPKTSADPGTSAFLTTGSGIGFFRIEICGYLKRYNNSSLLLLFLDTDSRSGIRDPKWVKIRIRDKHPLSATLPKTNGKSNSSTKYAVIQVLHMVAITKFNSMGFFCSKVVQTKSWIGSGCRSIILITLK